MKHFCTLYIVRHGLTDWNIERRLQGQTDVPLNKEGEKQAVEAAEKYFKNIHFDAVFSSDLLRAKRTAEIIALEKKIAVKTTKLLRERDFGPFEGKKIEQLEKKLKIQIDKFRVLTDKILRKLKIETNKEIMTRFMRFIREVAIAYVNKNVLIVTHGSVMRVFLEKIGRITKNQSKDLIIDNLAFMIVESDGVEFNLKKLVGFCVGDQILS